MVLTEDRFLENKCVSIVTDKSQNKQVNDNIGYWVLEI